MTEAEIKRATEEEIRASGANLSVASVKYDGAEAWNISIKSTRGRDFHFTVRRCGDTSIPDQIKSNLRNHAEAD